MFRPRRWPRRHRHHGHSIDNGSRRRAIAGAEQHDSSHCHPTTTQCSHTRNRCAVGESCAFAARQSRDWPDSSQRSNGIARRKEDVTHQVQSWRCCRAQPKPPWNAQNSRQISKSLRQYRKFETPTPRMHSCRPHTRTWKVRLRRQRPRRLLGVEACGGRKRSKHRKRVRTLGSVTVRRTTPSKETAK